MNAYIRSFMPDRISGQIVALIVVSLVVIHFVLAAAFYLNREPPPEPAADELAMLIKLIDARPLEARAALVGELHDVFPRFDLTLAERLPEGGGSLREQEILAGRLGPKYRVAAVEAQPSPGADRRRIAVRLTDGQVVTAQLIPMRPPLFGPFSFTLLAIALSVTLLGLWATRRLTGPLRRFAWAAEHFSPSAEIALLPERGPYEIRTAAQALNRMRQRIRSLLEDKTRMLVAVSHDLRTPITRVRLRCEFIKDQAARTQILGELAQMETMVESVLYYVRDGQRRTKPAMIDLASSLQTICDQFADAGHEVGYEGPDQIVIFARADELNRAITNLIDNAVRHGGKTDVRVSHAPPTVTVAIEDDGPGITEANKQSMFEPFVRGDTARNMNDKPGFGLGLSIARAVVEDHGGTLVLLDRIPHGLLAQVTLPDASAAADNANGQRAPG